MKTKDADALVLVLSLVENHPMWTEQRGNSQEFKDEVYAAITTVRQFLKANGVVTLHAVLEQLSQRADRARRAANAKRIDENMPWRHP